MGNTTLIEINNDRWDEIEKDKTGFVRSILQAIAGGVTLSIPGGAVICTFHRSGKLYEAWLEFKKKWF